MFYYNGIPFPFRGQAMSKLIGEPIKVYRNKESSVTAFIWRRRLYRVLEVLSWWREPAEWWDGNWDYRIPATITAGNYGSEDTPVVWSVDLADRLKTLGETDPFDPTSVRVIEYNLNGTVKGEVPSQYEEAPPIGAGIAVIQHADTYTDTTAGPVLDDLGIPYTEMPSKIEESIRL